MWQIGKTTKILNRQTQEVEVHVSFKQILCLQFDTANYYFIFAAAKKKHIVDAFLDCYF